jgi:hypothetical protein
MNQPSLESYGPAGFTPHQMAWIKLLSLVIGSAALVTATAEQGGCKWWIAVLLGIGTAGNNVYHALSDPPPKADAPSLGYGGASAGEARKETTP